MRINNVVLKPNITEKTVGLASQNKYVFKVSLSATKNSVSKKLHELYGVDVISVAMLVMPGKKRRILKTRRFTKTPKWKKAIVMLKEGQKIDIFPKEQ